MKQELFKSSVRGRFIKNLLCNTYIPIYDTVRLGDYIIKNCRYIYNISLIQCTKSGTLEGTGEFITLDDTFYWNSYKVNESQKFTSNTGFYDSETHEWLGNYLRAYRDMIGINLMPFYNCFSGVYTDRFKLKTEDNYIDVYQSSSSYDTYTQGTKAFNDAYMEKTTYKLFKVPVKLNRSYTIALDCQSTIKIAPAFINHGKLLEVTIGSKKLSLTDLYIQNKDSNGTIRPISTEITNSEFIHPFLYTLPNNNQIKVSNIVAEEDTGLTYEQLFHRYEKYLYLLIQVPKDNNSALVVLEGDYTEVSVDNVFSNEIINDQIQRTFNNFQTNIYNVEKYEINTNTNLINPYTKLPNPSYVSSCPWVSTVILPESEFKFYSNGKLKTEICSVEFLNIDNNSLSYNVGYSEYYFISNENTEYDYPILKIYSWVPITTDIKVKITYSNDSTTSIYQPYDPRNDDSFLDEMLISKLSLLQLNDNNSYPFSDVLIEYLLSNVIDSADEISDNIKRIQMWFGVQNSPEFTYGAWNNALRIDVFNTAKYINTIPHMDIIGYVDRNVESTTL